MNGNSYGSGYAAPTSRGMGAILRWTEGSNIPNLRKEDKGMLVSSLFSTFHDFDGEHQQEVGAMLKFLGELDDND